MRTGLLRHRITLQKQNVIQDEHGSQVLDDFGALIMIPSEEIEGEYEEKENPRWEDYVTVWASIEAMTGKEYFASQQTQTTVTHRIRIRRREDITQEMRVISGKRRFNIVAVLPDNDMRETILMCRELSYEQAA